MTVLPVQVQAHAARTIQTAPRAVYQVVQLKPDGYPHAECLTELADSVYFGLRGLGFEVHRSEQLLRSAQPIVFGAHLLDAAAADALPSDAIIYNTEQITDDSSWLSKTYLRALKSRAVWDYSRENVRRLEALGVERVCCVPVGYVPELSRIGPATEDIDVLFYGSMNPRRAAILEELTRRGLRVMSLFGSYGEERDKAIARAKVVLIVHFYESKVFEIVRAAYLFTNHKAIVAESGEDTAIEPDLLEAIRGVPYAGLVDACIELVRDETARRALATRGHAIFAARPATALLAAAVGAPALGAADEADRPKPTAGAIPRTLHVGSGKDFRPDAFNIDVNPDWGPDAVVDIAGGTVLGLALSTARFGPTRLEENYFDVIVANDVLEHIPDLPAAMYNCLRLLRPGGVLQVSVPYELGLGAWQDPTHVRALNENSWLYYSDWHWYLGWTEMRFDTLSVQFQPSAYGEQLIKQGKPREEILRTPRAVDTMRAVLRKRYLQPSERVAALARQPGRAGRPA